MGSLWFLLAALASFPAPAAAAQNQEIVIRGEIARMEIERILREDNLDSDRLGTDAVVEIMSAIQRGQAPGDFWNAYQAHVRAWQRYAQAETWIRGQEGATFIDGLDEYEAAGEAIDSTFDEVVRIARRYGARLPAPVGDRLDIV